MERLYNETTDNKQQQRMRPAHCIQVAVGWNGIPQICLCSPPGVTSFFRAVPRLFAIYFDNKVVPGIPKRYRRLRQKKKKKKNSFTGDNTTFLPLFRPFGGGEQQKDGGVDRGYYGNTSMCFFYLYVQKLYLISKYSDEILQSSRQLFSPSEFRKTHASTQP